MRAVALLTHCSDRFSLARGSEPVLALLGMLAIASTVAAEVTAPVAQSG